MTGPVSFTALHPDIAEAISAAHAPPSWEGRDELEMLSHIDQVCSWLGPFLPAPELLALATVAHAGKEVTFLCDEGPTTEAMVADLAVLIGYLIRYGAALECLASERKDAS